MYIYGINDTFQVNIEYRRVCDKYRSVREVQRFLDECFVYCFSASEHNSKSVIEEGTPSCNEANYAFSQIFRQLGLIVKIIYAIHISGFTLCCIYARL